MDGEGWVDCGGAIETVIDGGKPADPCIVPVEDGGGDMFVLLRY